MGGNSGEIVSVCLNVPGHVVSGGASNIVCGSLIDLFTCFFVIDESCFLLFDNHIVRLGTICFSVYNLHTLN